MSEFKIESLEELILQLNKLPGIGRKTAERLALFIVRQPQSEVHALSHAMNAVKSKLKFCQQCFNLTEQSLCHICRDPQRDNSIICVVEDIIDIIAIEKSREYKGVYHVLGGVISPLAGQGPDDIRLQELISRIENDNTRELLLALNPSTEGETTMIYISRLLKERPLRITRIASGIPFGSHLEFIDMATIGRAIASRRDFEDF